MRLLIVLLLLPMLAQSQITREQPLRFHLYFTGGIPVGSSNARSSDVFITGQTMNGGGVSFLFTLPVRKSWHIGIVGSFMNYKLDEDKVSKQIYERYKAPGYITEQKPIFTQTGLLTQYVALAQATKDK